MTHHHASFPSLLLLSICLILSLQPSLSKCASHSYELFASLLTRITSQSDCAATIRPCLRLDFASQFTQSTTDTSKFPLVCPRPIDANHVDDLVSRPRFATSDNQRVTRPPSRRAIGSLVASPTFGRPVLTTSTQHLEQTAPRRNATTRSFLLRVVESIQVLRSTTVSKLFVSSVRHPFPFKSFPISLKLACAVCL